MLIRSRSPAAAQASALKFGPLLGLRATIRDTLPHLSRSTTANESYCQVPGSATAGVFRQLLDRYLQSYVNMLGQLAACNRLHNVYERCAR